MYKWILPLALLGLVVGCSDDSEGNNPPKPDMNLSDFTTPAGDMDTTCGTGIYPCAPYGTNTGEVASNLEFMGYRDADEQCADHKSKSLDTTKAMQKIAFKDWYLGDTVKSCKKDLLWVMVSAGWCVPCQYEVNETQKQITAGAVDKRIALLNIVFETKTSGVPADEAFLKTWISTYKLTIPTVIDPKFRMGAYFDKKATPFNMLVDLKTMKVFYRSTGADLPGIGKKIQEYFAQ